LDSEGLENRLLLATIPAAAVTTIAGSPVSPIDLTGFQTVTNDGNANSPTVVVDPYDSQKVFAVWGVDLSSLSPVPHTTAVVEGAFSTDGGTDWSGLGTSVNPVLFPDPLTINAIPPTAYTQVTEPSVAFDSKGDVYVLTLQTSGASDGALVLTEFDFSGDAPFQLGLPNNGIVYQWVTGSDAATTPTLAVDTGTFPSGVTPPAGVPTDTYANNVYIAWASIDTEPADPDPYAATGFNPDRAELIVGTPIANPVNGESTLAFSGVTTVSLGGNFGPQQNTHPQLVINPGGADRGRITIGWEDAGTGAKLSPPVTLLMSQIVEPGKVYGFSGDTGLIAPAQTVTIGGTAVTVPITTPFNDTVDVPNPGAVDNLTVSLALVDQQSVQNLSVVLASPNGSEITLFLNQIDAAAKSHPGQGLPSGNSVGVYGFTTGPTGSPGIVVGTTFDDNATRDIFDSTRTGTNGNSAADYIGFFQPEFGSLAGFLAAATSGGGTLNGPWTLQVTNYSPTIAMGVPFQALLEQFSLQLSTRMTPPPGVFPSSIANEFNYIYPPNYPTPFTTLVVGGSLTNTYPTAAPSTPNGVGPGLVMAEDNTLGPYSPYQGRIYAAFVGYFYVFNPLNLQNPTTNTDIFLTYSDDGGQTWSSPELVNNDQATSDGYSQSNDNLNGGNNQITGRTQFQPEIAVDQSTGTVVLSWRDARDDAANARVATYITTSIDGGNTFGPQTYANPAKTSIDAITGQTNIIGPASDNQAGGNGQRDAGFGYGNQMGLAVADGQLFPIWAGNFYGPDPAGTDFIDSFWNTTTSSVNAFPLNIWCQPMTIAAGPRIISSTMGPVVAATLTGSAVDLPEFIPPVGSPNGTPTESVIPISGDPSLKVSSVEVTVSLTYPTDGNLTLSLIAPSGQSVTLYQNPSDKGQDFTNTTFSDTAAQLITSGTAPYTGTFRPVQPLANLDGLTAFGNWTLKVSGGIGPNGGILQSWSLSINGVASKPTSFEVTFDRPVDPQVLITAGKATFVAGDVQVFYHDTTNGAASIPLLVTGVAPVVPPYYVTDPTQDGVDGYTNFLVTFNPDKNSKGLPSGITNYTGTYSYVIAPDNGQVSATPTPISSPIWSFNTVPQPQPVISPATDPNAKTSPNIEIAPWGPGGSGTQFDVTQSTITLAGYNNQTISGLTVNLNITDPLTPPGLGNDGGLFIELTAPNGNTAILYFKPGDTNENFTNVTFSDQAAQSILLASGPYTNGTYQPYNPLTTLAGSPVAGVYTLTIDNYESYNAGKLLNWSITVNSTKLGLQFESGAAMDQNADGISDENPLTLPFTGLTPGDAYVAPMPQPTAPFTFNATNILNPPFDQNTLPLIFPGPYVVSTSVPGGTGSDNEVLNGTTSSLNVTFDRPMQTSTFTPGNVLQIMGPIGSISDPQYYPSDSTLQQIPAATATGSSVLDSTLTIPSFNGTFKIHKITVQLNIAFAGDSALSAVLIAPDGTQVPLFAGVGGIGSNFVNTTFDDAAETPIASGTAPFTGTYQPAGMLSTLDGKTVDLRNATDPALYDPGVWTLQITNSNATTGGTLENWSLNITPVITVTPVNPVNGLATTFTVGFPQQALSGTYTVQIGANVLTGTFPLDAAGDAVDSSLDAGLAVLRGGGPNTPVTTVGYNSSDLPKSILAPLPPSTSSQVTSTIIVPDNFVVQGDTTSSGISGLTVTLNVTYPFDPDLTLTLQHFDVHGNLLESVALATNVGASSIQKANFTNTTFDDNATTPIENGGAPFSGTFNPQMPLSAFAGTNAQGTWVLLIQNKSTTHGTGTFNSWSLSFQKPVPTSGLGVPGADDINASFRIFTLGQADAMSAEAWTPVGPASISAGAGVTTTSGPSGSAEATTAGRSGRVTGLAIDPSDPTGNTVYAAGASGGVWKTTDFLTTKPAGPTWIPLTGFGPSNAVNIGSITLFPRNDNTSQTIIIAATGEGNTGTPGVGFLVSSDGGATWTLDDSSVNVDASGNPLPIETSNPQLARNRTFVGDTAYQVVVDPKLSPAGGLIIYAAMAGPTGGIWRSLDGGAHWTNMLPGQATSVVLDPESAGSTGGNLQVVYAGIRGVGVEMSPNQGQQWTVMSGGIGNPLIFNYLSAPPSNVNPAAGPTPNGAEGRIALAVPDATGNAAEDPIYEGWLYAAVATPSGGFFGLFVTKDFGENWTEVHIPSLPAVTAIAQAVPTNDVNQPNYPITGGGLTTQGNYNLILAIDPTDPNVAYLGGSADGGETALARVDTTNLWDAHSLVAYSNFSNDGGSLNLSSTGPVTVPSLKLAPGGFLNYVYGIYDTTPYQNFIRNPSAPFLANATLDVYDYASFTNNGAGVTWIPFDPGGTDYHAVTTMVDPLTGLPRLIFGNDQGVWSILDNNGTFETQVGSSASGVQVGSPTDQLAGVDRNGNLQITQFYYGATQPSSAAAQIAGALFYGSAQDDGGPVSDPNIIQNGNMTWNGPGGDATGVGTDQQGLGTAYQYFWPCCGGNYTDFFQYIGPGLSGAGLSLGAGNGYVGRTFGLLQASGGIPTPDPQWPYTGGANFAVDPVNSANVVISSAVGRIFATQNNGVTWFDVGDPGVFGSPSSFSLALAYGAPDPSAPNGIGNLGNFIYVGTQTGQIYVTQNGGGSGAANNWINISAGLDGSAVESITTDPLRGSHDAYAVTASGVFYMANSIASASNPNPKWVNITSNIHKLAYSIFGQTYDPTGDTGNSVKLNQALSLSSIVADWRYQIPFDPTDPSQGTHPVLYVGSGSPGSNGSGVYQSLDNGATWTLFPDKTYGAVAEGGDLPHVSVTDLNVSLGNVNATTGMPNLAGPDQVFVFTGTLTSGMASIAGVNNLALLAVGDTVTGTGIPNGTTILGLNSSTNSIMLSAKATASGFQTLAAANPTATPDPDVLLATTYGGGQFAINLAPLILGNTVTASPSMPGTGPNSPPIVTGPITITGSSEVSAFGNTTWISVVDLTPGDPTYNQIISGFNPANGVPVPNASNSTDFQGNFAISLDPETAFATSHGLKTIAIVATDNAGSVGNKVTFTFDLNPASQLVFDPTGEPPMTAPAGVNFAAPSPAFPSGSAVIVYAEDTHDSIDPFYNGPVTLALAIGANGTFPVTANAVNGVATFTDLAIDTAGTYILTATSGTLTPGTSTSITITAAAPEQLVWTVQPPNEITVNNVFGTTPTLEIEDKFGNQELGYTQKVTVGLELSGNPANGSLAGMATVPAINGVAAFPGLSITAVGNPYTLVATTTTQTSVTLTSPPSDAINVVAPTLQVTGQPLTSVTAGNPFQVVVTAYTFQGTVDTAFTDTLGLAINSGPNGAMSNLPTTATAASGVATFSGVTLDTAGAYILQASDSSLNLTIDTSTITVVAAGVDHLVFLQEPPPSVYARSAAGFGLVVGAQDKFNNPTTLSGMVTVQISTNPSGGALDGMTTVNAAGGVATFAGLSISIAGNGYKLTATSNGHTSPPSTPIDVLPAPAVSLEVSMQPPPSVMVHQTFVVQVKAYDQFNQFDPDFNGSVTISVASGPGTINGTIPVTAVNGIATFSDLYLTTVGNGYTLSASSTGLTSATTMPFNVTAAAASQLIILSPPVPSVTAGTAFGFVVEAEDKYGNLATSFNGTVTAALVSGPSGGTLGGTLMATANTGVAVFSDLVLDQASSTPYILSASASGLTGINTSGVTVTAAAASQLVITPSSEPPALVTAGVSFGLTVTAEDPYGNVATTFNSPVFLALATNPTTSGTLGGVVMATASKGQAAFTSVYLDTATPGSSGYTIKATSGKLTPVTTTPIAVTPAAAAALVVSIPPPTSPTTVTSGSLFGLQISALDPFGNLATGGNGVPAFTGAVTIALVSSPPGAMLTGPLTVNATAGVANFLAAITTETAGTYTLEATSPGLTPVPEFPTGGILVIPAPATQLVIMPAGQPPNTVAAGQKFTVVIDAEDQSGNVNPNFNGMISIAIASGSSTLGGTTNVAAVKGVATFNNLTLTASSAPVTLQATSVGLTPPLTPVTTSAITVTPPAQLAFSVAGMTVDEPAGSATSTATITVVRSSSGYQGAVSVNVATSGGTAVAGVNYTAVNQVLNFLAGQNSQKFTIPIKNAGVLSKPLTVNVVLSNPPGANAVLGSPETLTIQNANVVNAPLVTVTGVQTKKNTKSQVTGIVIDFSGAVIAAEAQRVATYELIEANKSGSFTGTGTTVLQVKSAVYNSTSDAVTLTPAPFGLSRPVELIVFGTGPNGLHDAEHRYIDGAHTGKPGSNAVVIISKGGATINAVPKGPLGMKHQRARR